MVQRHEGAAVGPMLIKRYGGCRLYNTKTLSYATPDQLRAMVHKGEPLLVRDARTGNDVTREVLYEPP
jgi:polyhydroxyalkanoate synthesis regulator protein